jgi:hypothetical protein
VSTSARASGGIVWSVLGAWADLRGSMRAELARDSGEPRLLVYLMVSGFVWFLGQVAVLAWGPAAPAMSENEFTGRVAAAFLGSMFFRTLAFYGLAAAAGLIARRFGGTATWRETRAATFWAALVAAPVILLATLVSVLVAEVPGVAGPVAEMLGAIAFGWALAHCLAEAHGFARAWKVLAVEAAIAALVVGVLYVLLGL